MRSANSELLKEVATKLNPSLVGMVNWNGIWDRPLETGTAFEWTTFIAVLAAASEKGWKITYPLFDIPQITSCFVSRNELPIQHGAQAGHSALPSDCLTLEQRFLAALIPKAVLTRNGEVVSVFREGYPYHAIMSDSAYLDRPDIVFAPGSITYEFPKLISGSALIDFSYDFPLNKKVEGQLRAINTSLRPIRKRMPTAAVQMPVIEIIECSVNKTADAVREQSIRYSELFSSPEKNPTILPILGNELDESAGISAEYINLSDLPSLETSFLLAGRRAVEILDAYFVQE